MECTIISSDSDIEAGILKTGSTFSSYFFIPASFYVDMRIKEDVYSVVLQTGHSYYCNDYNQPSNSLDFYEPPALIKEILNLDDDFTSEDIEESDYLADFSEDEIYKVKKMIQDLCIDLELEIKEAEQEEEAKLSEDNNTYLLKTEREKIETYYNEFEYRVCSNPQILKFSTRDEAEKLLESIDDEGCDTYRIVDKETAISCMQRQ